MNIILVGFMGSGKSSAARFISKNYPFRFVDTDRLIEKKLKMSVREIFEKYGEKFFRAKEREIILTNLSFCTNCVVATGGGLPCSLNNMEELKKIGWVFYIQLSFEKIEERIKNRANRPLFDNHKEALELYNKRIPCYKEAHFIIDGLKDTQSIAKEIMSKISP